MSGLCSCVCTTLGSLISSDLWTISQGSLTYQPASAQCRHRFDDSLPFTGKPRASFISSNHVSHTHVTLFESEWGNVTARVNTSVPFLYGLAHNTVPRRSCNSLYRVPKARCPLSLVSDTTIRWSPLAPSLQLLSEVDMTRASDCARKPKSLYSS